MSELVSIAFDDWIATLAPAIGGSICSLKSRGEPILRETPAEAIKTCNVRLTACYPLTPYANRIAKRQFTFGGECYHLAENFPGSPHSLHGVGWRRPWRVESVDQRSCTLALEHRLTGRATIDWPFVFDAHLQYSLGAEGLTVTESITNVSKTDAPAGIGLHAFFPRRPGQRIAFRSTAAWRNGPDMLPADRFTGGPWDYSGGRTLDADALDNDFVGWDGIARLSALKGPCVTLRASPAFNVLRLFAPPGAAFVAVEPVSHRADAINYPQDCDGPMTVLVPGATLLGQVRFILESEQ